MEETDVNLFSVVPHKYFDYFYWMEACDWLKCKESFDLSLGDVIE